MLDRFQAIAKNILPIVFLIGIALIGYEVERHQTAVLLPLYFVSFISFCFLIQHSELFTLKSLIVLGIIARIILLPSLPILSDDVYRFIWDGRLLAEGINPFSQVPSYYINNSVNRVNGLTDELFQLLNSQNNHTIYPPVVQFIFWGAALVFPNSIYGSIVFIRIFHFLADLGVLYFAILLLKHYKLPKRNVFFFFLNPLVILELTGNLHAEGIMLLFLLAGVYYYLNNKLFVAGVFWALAVATKLIPLILLPYVLLVTSLTKNIRFFGAFTIASIILFSPLLDLDFIYGMQSSVSLYFQKFEFNASIYYIVREIGYWVKGYNIIEIAGKVLAVCSFIVIISFSAISKFKKWGIFETFTLIFLAYFLFTNILHPWYVIGILALSMFTKFRFTLIWSGLIFLTYTGYTVNEYNENLWLVAIEYGTVIGVFIYELIKKRSLSAINQ